MAEKQIDGLGFDKLVFDMIERESVRERGEAHISVDEAKKELGLTEAQVLRAVSLIRAKGYPVVSLVTNRTGENRFKIPQSEKDYTQWRSRMVDDLRALIDVLKVCDAGAKARFGIEMPVQTFLF